MSTPKVRTTVTLDHDLVERFAEVASKERRSFSATINGWLQQVIEPAEFVAAQIDHDRSASAERLRTLMGSIQVVNEQATQAMDKARAPVALAGAALAKRGAAAVVQVPPRLVIRGGNSPGRATKQSQRGSP